MHEQELKSRLAWRARDILLPVRADVSWSKSCWRMLTGVGYRAGSLTTDQIARVQHLVTIDAGMRTIKGDAVGEWMVAGKGSAVTSGSSPIDS